MTTRCNVKGALLLLCGAASCSAAPVAVHPGAAAALPSKLIGGDLYSATPSGYILSHCVHEVPAGAHVRKDQHGALSVEHPSLTAVRHLPACVPLVNAANPTFRARDERPRAYAPSAATAQARTGGLPADYDGWLQYTMFKSANASAGFESFVGEMSVPDIPKKRPQILYLFPGLQNIDWIPKVDPEPTANNPFDIVQPVLQYPGTRPGEWAVRSWYVTVNTGALMSTELPVATGDAIVCNMTRTHPYGWFIGSKIKSSGKETNQLVSGLHPGAIKRLGSQPWAYNTLECYGCDGCGTFPTKPCEFTKLVLATPDGQVEATWAPNPKPALKKECKEATVVHNSSAVTISFQ